MSAGSAGKKREVVLKEGRAERKVVLSSQHKRSHRLALGLLECNRIRWRDESARGLSIVWCVTGVMPQGMANAQQLKAPKSEDPMGSSIESKGPRCAT